MSVRNLRRVGVTGSFLALRLLILPIPPSIAAETHAAWIAGSVFAANGSPLVYANVFLVGTRNGGCSCEDGSFLFAVEEPGTFVLQASYVGYADWQTQIIVTADDTLRINIMLGEQPVQLPPVIVTASSFSTADRDGVTLSTLDVVTTPGAAADVFRAIQTFPGVQQVEEGAGLFVRGGDVSETITILDGAVLSHPYKHESPTGGFFGTISPFLLSGTYFSSGGFSAEYGNALSGAMVMESLGLPQTAQVQLGLGLAAGSVIARLPLIKDRLGVSLSGNQSFTEALFQMNRSTERFLEYPYSQDVNLNLVYRPYPSTTLKLFLFDERDGLGLEVHDPDYQGTFAGKNRNSLYNLVLKQIISDNLLIRGNVAYATFKAEREMTLLDLKQEDWMGQGRLSAEYRMAPGIEVRGGLDWFRIGADITGRVPAEIYDLDPGGEFLQLDTHYRSDRPAGWMECRLRMAGRLMLVPGVRLSGDEVSGETTADPRASFVFQLSPSSSLKFATGLYHQYPALAYYDPESGNPELGSSESRHMIVAYDRVTELTQFRIEAYDKAYDNLILDDDRLNLSNGGHGYARGVDVFLKTRLPMVEGWTSYSYLRARRLEGEFRELTSPRFDITHNWTLVLKCALPYGFYVGSTYRYATGMPYTPCKECYNQARVPIYKRLDLSFSTIRSLKNTRIVYYLAAANILNRMNIFGYRYSEDYTSREPIRSSFGRSVYFGASVIF